MSWRELQTPENSDSIQKEAEIFFSQSPEKIEEDIDKDLLNNIDDKTEIFVRKP